MKTPCIIAISLLMLGACGSDEEQPSVRTVQLQPIESFDSALWTGTIDPDDPIVATVNGTKISLSMLKVQLERAEPDAKPEDVLQRMIEFELLAREAFAAGHHTEEVAGEAVHKALARRYVQVTFDEQLKPSDMPHKQVLTIYKKMRARYDHFDRFLIADIQILCCTADSPDGCYRHLFPEDVEARGVYLESCFAAHKDEVEALHRQLSRYTESKAVFKANAEAAFLSVPSPELSAQFGTSAKFHLYDFQYDINRSYEEQFERPKYRVFLKSVMEGVKQTWLANGKQTPALTSPIRSQYGYHIILIYKVHPEKHWGPDRPEVKEEIQEQMYNKWRKLYFRDEMDKLCKRLGCEVKPDRLVPLQKLDDAKL